MDASPGAAWPDWRGVRGVRRVAGPDVPLVPWGCTHDAAVELTGATPHPDSQGRWLDVRIAPFSDRTEVLSGWLSFSDGRLAKASFTVPDHDWSPREWVTDELISAYGEPTDRHLPEPGVMEDYETIHWRVPGLAVVHGLFSIYAGPVEAAAERIEFTAL